MRYYYCSSVISLIRRKPDVPMGLRAALEVAASVIFRYVEYNRRVIVLPSAATFPIEGQCKGSGCN